MHSIFYDAAVPDEVRRGNLFQGQLYVYSPRPISIELCNLANDLAREAFAPHEPCEAQHHLPVGQFARTLADLKPRFIHHPQCKRLLPELLRELGCDLGKNPFRCARLSPALPAGETPAPERVEPPHWESSLGLMKVTT